MATEPAGDRAGNAAGPQQVRSPFLRALCRTDTLAGLMFIAVAAAALWISRDYPLGTLRRMGAGYMPQLLAWALMGLGIIVLCQGLLAGDRSAHTSAADPESDSADHKQNLWSVVFVTASLVAFALSIERFGLIIAILLLVAIASFAYRGLRWWETLLTALFMIALSWAVFVLGLGISVKVLPEGLPWTF